MEKILISIVMILPSLILFRIYDFKRGKKKYLPLITENNGLPLSQKNYVLKHLTGQRMIQGFYNSDMFITNIDEVINKVKYNELDEKILESLNSYFNNLTLVIGFIEIK